MEPRFYATPAAAAAAGDRFGCFTVRTIGGEKSVEGGRYVAIRTTPAATHWAVFDAEMTVVCHLRRKEVDSWLALAARRQAADMIDAALGAAAPARKVAAVKVGRVEPALRDLFA